MSSIVMSWLALMLSIISVSTETWHIALQSEPEITLSRWSQNWITQHWNTQLLSVHFHCRGITDMHLDAVSNYFVARGNTSVPCKLPNDFAIRKRYIIGHRQWADNPQAASQVPLSWHKSPTHICCCLPGIVLIARLRLLRDCCLFKESFIQLYLEPPSV